MKFRLEFTIMASVVLCLLLAQVAPAKVVKKCYIDGNDVAQQTGSRALNYNFHRLIIAAEGDPTFCRYNGLRGAIDEFAIYDKLLEDPCIVAHANTPPADYVATVTADAPVLWLRFEDPCSANGYTAADSSGNDQNGVYIGDGPGGQFGDVNLVAGFVGNAAEFYGTADCNGTCIDVNDANGALELQDLTVEFWLKSTDLYGDPLYYTKFFQHNGTNQDANGYGAMVVGGPNSTVGLIGGGSTEFDPTGVDMNDGEWHHVVFTFDSTPDPNYDPNISPYPYEIAEDNPALYVRCEALPLVDESGNGLWVDADSAVTIQKVTGSMGNCALLSSGWIAAANQQTEPCLPTDYNHAYAFGDDITVEFWLYYPPGTSVDNYAGLWNQNAGTDITTWSPGCSRATEKCRMRCNDNRTSGNPDGYAYTDWDKIAWATDANVWHHHVAIYDVCDDPCTLTVKYYVDNVNKKNSTYTPDTFDNYLGPEMDHILFGNVGSRETPGNNAYRQYIDEIAVYDHVLTIDRIDAHYRAWQPRSCEEWRDRGMAMPIADRNQDCKIDFYDFASWVDPTSWGKCNDPCDPNCPPDW